MSKLFVERGEAHIQIDFYFHCYGKDKQGKSQHWSYPLPWSFSACRRVPSGEAVDTPS